MGSTPPVEQKETGVPTSSYPVEHVTWSTQPPAHVGHGGKLILPPGIVVGAQAAKRQECQEFTTLIFLLRQYQTSAHYADGRERVFSEPLAFTVSVLTCTTETRTPATSHKPQVPPPPWLKFNFIFIASYT